jgi:hypothetical protein
MMISQCFWAFDYSSFVGGIWTFKKAEPFADPALMKIAFNCRFIPE